ncbi:universal stress protein [Rhodobacteraceae bacterium KMM 6894]|nr:universal stress protein [Rhodobacteraceae bacterium KMM 6894]
MKKNTILIVIGKDAPMDDLAKKLETLRTVSAHVVILIVGEMPAFPYYAVGIDTFGTTDVPGDWSGEVASHKAVLDDKAKDVRTLLQQHDVSGEVSTVACEPALMADAVARRAMLCDMAIISDDLRDPDTLFRQAVHGVLFQSPVGVVLNDPTAEAMTAPKRVFVAWNTQLHSARALHQALPMLRQADEVVIAMVDPVMSEFRDGEDPGVDVAKWLTHHGCNVVVATYPSGGKDIGTCILDRAKEAGADLIVMGAYGHSRTRETIFGGTTKTLISQTDQVVFLAH